MSDGVRTLVAVDENVNKETVQAVLPITSEIQIVGVVDGLEESWATLQETPTDLLLVACHGYSERALVLIDGAVKQRPERPVVVLSDAAANGFTRRVFEAGADDILELPEPPQAVLFALQKAIARRRGSTAAGVATAPLICVLGPKGGTGKTLTTCNLGVALAQMGQRVAIIDLDLQFGDVGLALGLAPEHTIHDLSKAGGSLDADKVESFMAQHPSGARALLAPTRPDQAAAISAELLREVYAVLRSSHDVVIVDTPPGFTPEVIASIDSSTNICMVAMLDSLSLKNTKLGLETLELMGYDQARIDLVLNRSDTRVGITRDDVAHIAGRAPEVFVPSDRDIPRSINEGMPIVVTKPRSDAARAFEKLAGMYMTANGAESPKRRRLLRGRS